MLSGDIFPVAQIMSGEGTSNYLSALDGKSCLWASAVGATQTLKAYYSAQSNYRQCASNCLLCDYSKVCFKELAVNYSPCAITLHASRFLRHAT